MFPDIPTEDVGSPHNIVRTKPIIAMSCVACNYMHCFFFRIGDIAKLETTQA